MFKGEGMIKIRQNKMNFDFCLDLHSTKNLYV